MKELKIIAIVILFSCSTKKILIKGNTIYSYSTVSSSEGSPVDQYTPHKVIKPRQVEITENGTYLILSDKPALEKDSYTPGKPSDIIKKEQTSWKRETNGKGYFHEDSDSMSRNFIWYKDNKVVLQAATIPIKIRPAIRNSQYKDTFPSQTETGFNVGFLVGAKKTWNST